MLADTSKPPYYAVIFTSIKKVEDEGYDQLAEKMLEIAKKQPGFLGAESVRNDLGITASYWKNLESIKSWKNNPEHVEAQQLGRSKWYKQFKIRICKVEQDRGFSVDDIQ